MEGDLLGLDFGQTPASNQKSQDAWSSIPDVVHLQPPAEHQQTPFPKLRPPTVQLSPPIEQIQLSSTQYNQPTVQQQPPALQQPPTIAQAAQVSNTSTTIHVPSVSTSVIGSSITSQNVTNAGNTVWKPSPLHDEPKDPMLREIKEKFAGRWKLVRSDPYDDYLKAAGVGIFGRKIANTGAPEQHIEIKGSSIHIDFHATLHNQIHVFKLEESVENMIERTRQSVFCAYKDGKLTLLMTPLEPGMNRTQEVQRYINDHGELVLIYTCGTSTCRRYFARLADIVSPLNIVG